MKERIVSKQSTVDICAKQAAIRWVYVYIDTLAVTGVCRASVCMRRVHVESRVRQIDKVNWINIGIK